MADGIVGLHFGGKRLGAHVRERVREADGEEAIVSECHSMHS
jgi:hypothetical protein